MAKLKVISGPAAGTTITPEDELVFGRRESGPGRLGGDEQLSRRHARIFGAPGGGLQIEDLGSTNGTFVNGARISGPHPLRTGDRIQVGISTIEVTEVEAVRTAAVAAPSAAVPAAPPTFSPPLQQRGRMSRGLLWAWLALLVVGGAAVGLVLVLTSGGGGGGAEEGNITGTVRPDIDGPVSFTAYVESNIWKPKGENSVMVVRWTPGRTYRVANFPTGGTGSHDLTDSGVLDADQQVITDPDHTLLFAVNQGSDTVAVFHILDNGNLQPVSGSPFPSGGPGPASLGLSGDILVVVNKGQDGLRDLSDRSPNVTTFRIESGGKLEPTGSTFPLPSDSIPTQALVSADGSLVFDTFEAGPLQVLRIGPDGSITQGPNSPLDPEDSLFSPGFADEKKFALGLALHPSLPLLYVSYPTIPALAVYRYDRSGTLSFIRGVVNEGAFLPCWTVVDSKGAYLYTNNAGAGTLSAFSLTSDPSDPQQIQTVAYEGKGQPWNIAFDPTGNYLVAVTPRATYATPPGEGNTIQVFSVKADGTLTQIGTPVDLPVATDVEPIGLAVTPGG